MDYSKAFMVGIGLLGKAAQAVHPRSPGGPKVTFEEGLRLGCAAGFNTLTAFAAEIDEYDGDGVDVVEIVLDELDKSGLTVVKKLPDGGFSPRE